MNLEVGNLRPATGADRYLSPEMPVFQDKERARLLIYGTLLLIDWASILAGFAIVGLFYLGSDFWETGSSICAALLPVYTVVAFNRQAYSIRVIRKPTRGMLRSVGSLLIGVAAVLLIAFYLKASAEMSRFVLGAGTALACGFMVAGRALFGALSGRILGSSPRGVLVITDGVDFAVEPDAPRLCADKHMVRPDINDPLMLDRLGRYLKNVERVIVACRPERRHDWAMALKGANVTGEIIAAELDAVGAIGTDSYAGHATLRVSCGPLAMRERIMKRLFDFGFSLAALIALAPLMLVVALAIKLDSPGPVFFVQPRLGRGNRLFNMLKFRSMRAEMCDQNGSVSTMRVDDRITRVGKFIRRTSMDELPQILNVLLGDMSLIGPRPHALGSTVGSQLFWEVDTRYWHRHALKPGITGLAQVRGYRGATHEHSDLTNRLQADLEYLAGWTIWRDISILFATVRVVVHGNAF